MAGYSATPLIRKLGIRSGMRILLIGAPDGYALTLGPLPEDVRTLTRPGKDLDFIQLFAPGQAALRRSLPRCVDSLAQTGMLWLCWPKKASGVRTDLDENSVRAAGLATGLVDVKVCAVDDTWSGLKFVYRLKDRKPAK